MFYLIFYSDNTIISITHFFVRTITLNNIYVIIQVSKTETDKKIALNKSLYRPRLRPNYLSKFVCTQWTVWLVYSSSWILVNWKFYCLTNSNTSSVYTNWCTLLTSDKKSIFLICLMMALRSNRTKKLCRKIDSFIFFFFHR